MFETCARCGRHSDRAIMEGSELICPECGNRTVIRRLPLFFLSGASGAGKSTAARILFDTRREFLTLECDILWHERFNTPENNYADFRDVWLSLAANYAQHGHVSLLCGAVTPEQITARPRHRYFSDLHFCAVALSDAEYLARAQKRGFSGAHLESSLNFNRWLMENGAAHGVHIIDATGHTPDDTAAAVAEFVLSRL